MTTIRKLVIALSIASAGCGGATPKVIAYSAMWDVCLEVENEVAKSHQTADEKWRELQTVRDVCDRMAKKVYP